VASNFDNAAWFYDGLSRLVYGKALINSQVYLLQYVKPGSNILIVGGGTGWILEELTKIYPSGLQITYVEISSKMIALSQKRYTGNNEVVFINDAIEKVTGLTGIDMVITPFLFDNFTVATARFVFAHIHSALKQDGLWLNADFQLTGKWWQNVLLKSMLLFFKILCGIEATQMHYIEPCFIKNGYGIVAGKTFFGDFIISKVYIKHVNIL
jgi:ubiquinone/menaquinone biosynthesis C-methylase UbiE